ALGDLVALAPGEHRGKCRFAGAVRPHDRMHLTGRDRKVDALEDFAPVLEARVEVFDLKHQISVPPRRRPGPIVPLSRCCPASTTANDPRHRETAQRWAPAFAGVVDEGAHHPTLPSRLTARSFCASTANSIGSSFNTSRQKPLTISDSAS